ncbi:hypothetical protein JY651_38965 [Pyxidicoccus parkwayensis]|uniref:Tetratricopeptide repeat protein n=1 Tax=Pyxidicoccus parkwayensis TaxID=2813578 RepID=A0ABX7NUD6_9BACT|nr:hypothetical protein [Pyxidicoccus parkwaysis]QSQ21130.1 hypothetical protein JY651_38965 [Pyxidicoccus parkwaysis]
MERSQYLGMALGVVIALFLIGGPRLRELPAGATMAWGAVVCVFCAVIIIRNRRWVQAMDEAARKFDAGDLAGAVRGYETAVRRATRSGERIRSTYLLGGCHHVAGDVESALRVLEPLFRKGGSWEVPAVHSSLPIILSICHTLRGDVATARDLLKEAERRLGAGLHGTLLLPEVFLLCRESHFAAALRVLELRWKEAEAGDVRNYKLLRLLRAFALSELGNPDSQALASDALSGLQPFTPGAFDPLGASWPQMKSFLEAHALSSRSQAA